MGNPFNIYMDSCACKVNYWWQSSTEIQAAASSWCPWVGLSISPDQYPSAWQGLLWWGWDVALMNGLRAATLDRAPPWESLHLYRSLSATTYNLRARGGQNNVRDNKWVKAQHNGVTEVYLWCHTWIKKINPEGITETGRVSVTAGILCVFLPACSCAVFHINPSSFSLFLLPCW